MYEYYYYCLVRIPSLIKPLYYISKNGYINKGIYVIVPFGDYYIKAKVLSCDIYHHKNVPYPIDRTKLIYKIISKDIEIEPMPIPLHKKNKLFSISNACRFYYYCKIKVENIDKTYYYISDFGYINSGTKVKISFGSEYRIGTVASCSLYNENNIPYPIHMTKSILSIINDKNLSRYSDYDDEFENIKIYYYCKVEISSYNTYRYYKSPFGYIPTNSIVIIMHKGKKCVGKVISCEIYKEKTEPYPINKTCDIISVLSKNNNVITIENENDKNKIPKNETYFIKKAKNHKYKIQIDPKKFINFLDKIIDPYAEINLVNSYIKNNDYINIFNWANKNHETSNKEIGKKLIECYTLCLKKNMPEAALNLGTLYYSGRFVNKDYVKAFELYKIAADANIKEALCNCGYSYYYGRHCDVNYKKAFKYFNLAVILHNDPNSMYKLGDIYLNGYGKKKNEKYAFKLYERALYECQINSNENSFLADIQYRYGKCLLYGIGTKKDVKEAHKCLSYALANFIMKSNTNLYTKRIIKHINYLLKLCIKNL